MSSCSSCCQTTATTSSTTTTTSTTSNSSLSSSIISLLDVLTVGDGDLSCSLALMRAYCAGGMSNNNNNNHNQQQQIRINRMVATTLLSSYDDLVRTYPQSKNIVKELLSLNNNSNNNDVVTILYGVDATQLHRHPYIIKSMNNKFDWIVFHHPHLGYSNEDEKQHAQNHACLIAHYLYSAHQVIKPKPTTTTTTTETSCSSCSCDAGGGIVHLCLCGNQVHSWKVDETIERLGLHYTSESPRPTSRPFFFFFFSGSGQQPSSNDDDNTSTTNNVIKYKYKAPRKFRNGKLGSRHWLGNYGYQHQRTHPAASSGKTTNVSNSYHYYFQKDASPTTATATKTCPPFCCEICTRQFANAEELEDHMSSPALPTPTDGGCGQSNGEAIRKQQQQQLEGGTVSDDIISSSPSLSSGLQQQGGTQRKGSFTNKIKTDATSNTTSIVSEEYHEKRLRWFLQHGMQIGSKRYCERSIVQDGIVHINGKLAIDSGRILQTGDEVEVYDRTVLQKQPADAGTAASNTKIIRIAQSWTSTCHVVYKPVGMPIKDGSHPNALDPTNHSLEGYFSKQLNSPYVCRTKLDRGCGGLVVVSAADPLSENDSLLLTHKMNRVFVALVHNIVPIDYEWGSNSNVKTADGQGTTVNLPIEGLRRWKKKPKKANETATTVAAADGGGGNTTPDSGAAAEIFVLERTTANTSDDDTNDKTQHISGATTKVPALSTVMIRTASPVSSIANVICYYLRKSGYGVVGDRFMQSEYFTLPRSIRNRIKQNLCIGCARIEVVGGEAADGAAADGAASPLSSDNDGCDSGDRNPHQQQQQLDQRFLYMASEEPLVFEKKWSAHYWQEHCCCLNSNSK